MPRGARVEVTVFTATGALRAPSTMTSIITPARTAMPTAATTATADRKLMSSIRA
ncbi:MAG TPA: hypothetical protein VF070_47050 [Streptosporangiaceae bacterium]